MALQTRDNSLRARTWARLVALDGVPDKIDRITMVNPSVMAVANDNDFGLRDETLFDALGNLANDTGAVSRILDVTLPQPLPLPPPKKGRRFVARDVIPRREIADPSTRPESTRVATDPGTPERPTPVDGWPIR